MHPADRFKILSQEFPPGTVFDIETNVGHFFYTSQEALDAFDDLAPGETFNIHAIRFDMSGPAERN